MECFELFRKHLAMCGIEMLNKSSKIHPINVKNATISALLCIYASLVTLLLTENNTFDEITDIFFRISCVGCFGIIYQIIVWKSSRLFEFIDHINDTVQARLKHPKSQSLYIEAGKKLENRMEILHTALIKVTSVLSIWPPVIFNYITYYTTDLDKSALELPLPLWLPFETKTPIGYLIAVTIENILIMNLLVTLKCLTTFGCGTCSMLFPLTEDLKNKLETINSHVRHRKNRSKITKQLSQFIKFHCKLLELIDEYSDLLGIIFVVIFIWGMAGSCTMMLLLNMKMDTINTPDKIALCVKMFWVFSLAIGVYEFGQRLTCAFEEINATYDQFTWYLFPYKAQRMLLTSITFAQRSVELRVFGSTSCGRITLQNVINTAYSGFMLIRRLEN